jgi:hypothetical protein
MDIVGTVSRSVRTTRLFAAAFVWVVACGSRTELLTPFPIETGPGGTAPGDDAGTDASRDGPPVDAPLEADAPLDVDLNLCPQGTPPNAYLLDAGGTLYVFTPATLAVSALGTPSCMGASGGPWTLSVSREGVAYVVYEDWSIYAVELASLRCTRTPFVFGEQGIENQFGIAVSRDPSAERLYVLGTRRVPPSPLLAASDLVSFQLSPVAVSGAIGGRSFDIQADLASHLYVYTPDGELSRIDLTAGRVEWSKPTNFLGPGNSWAVMPYEGQIYLFANQRVARFDEVTGTTTPLGTVSTPWNVVGASGVPCVARR